MAKQLTMAHVLLAAGALALIGGGAQAQGKTSSSSAQKTGTVPAADKKFAMAAAQGGLTEVQLGEIATKQGSSDAVKQFGQKMVDDHGKANDDLKSVASNKGLALPTEPNASQKATIARLSKLHGAAFDSAYIKDMKADHKKDIADFKKESTSGQDSDIKAFATRTLPVVESHYSMLMNMGSSSGGKMSTTKKM
ncbi:MAG: outer membrane protein [Chthonomonadaceae bacterium]|nr:outer membrane protein [Chthonomonadaceae bacterium]